MINHEYINKIASLANIDVSESEKETFIEHMKNILDYVKILKEVDIDDEVFACKIETKAVILRNDDVEPYFDRESLLKNAPSEKDGYFIIPNILST